MNEILRIFIAMFIGVICGIIIGSAITSRMHHKQVYRKYIYKRNMYCLGLINQMATRRDMSIDARLDCIGDLIYGMIEGFSIKHKLCIDDAHILKDWEDILNSCRCAIHTQNGYSELTETRFNTCISMWIKTRGCLPMFEQMQIAHNLYTIFKLIVYEQEQRQSKPNTRDKKQSKSADGKRTTVAVIDEMHGVTEEKKPTADEVVQTVMDAVAQNQNIHMQDDSSSGVIQYNPR